MIRPIQIKVKFSCKYNLIIVGVFTDLPNIILERIEKKPCLKVLPIITKISFNFADANLVKFYSWLIRQYHLAQWCASDMAIW